ncbi:DUF427 domain-containing protein [Nocardioides sp. CFH 31398]|uniref:DUF427 domain-containing protein n=1 Tax=Nocardioides sp. CFH 31398 TaxID=2919579 RepID=UPI001F0559F4|nr:DUF427 domain-containing protein [Nocardioides sp. CFH 31398]MCH1867183.1 DUF427 domain-containing protein [Nocardioides sp. CFH 31398]
MATTISGVLEQARAELRHQATPVRVRAEWGGEVVVDTTGAHLVWEPRRLLCVYAVPEADLRGVVLEPAGGEAPTAPEDGVLFPDVPFAAHTAEGESLDLVRGEQRAARAALRPADPDLAGLVVLDPEALDAWWHEGERIVGHPRDPFHRVDALPGSRRVTVSRDGEVLARTDRAVAVNETGFPLRWYVPRDDLLVEVTRTATRTECPYKGEASYWTAAGVTDVAWSYEEPLTEVVPAGGHLCFDDTRCEVEVEIAAGR